VNHLVRPSRLVFIALLLGMGCFTGNESPALSDRDRQSVDRILTLMAQRLNVMENVARVKWNEGGAVTDPERERASLQSLVHRGKDKGLSPSRVESFFQAQMEAGKQIQRAAFDQWKREHPGPFPGATPLSRLRESIDGINLEMIEALSNLSRGDKKGHVRQYLEHRSPRILVGQWIDEAVREKALEPLRAQD